MVINFITVADNGNEISLGTLLLNEKYKGLYDELSFVQDYIDDKDMDDIGEHNISNDYR